MTELVLSTEVLYCLSQADRYDQTDDNGSDIDEEVFPGKGGVRLRGA